MGYNTVIKLMGIGIFFLQKILCASCAQQKALNDDGGLGAAMLLSAVITICVKTLGMCIFVTKTIGSMTSIIFKLSLFNLNESLSYGFLGGP